MPGCIGEIAVAWLRVDRANWAGANSQSALSCFVRAVMASERPKVWQGAGLGQFMTGRRVTVTDQSASDSVTHTQPDARVDVERSL